MPISRLKSNIAINKIFNGKNPKDLTFRLSSKSIDEKPLPPNMPREAIWTKEAQDERLRILWKRGVSFKYLSGKKQIEDPGIFEGNVENYIGLAQLPVGAIGPLRINGINANGDYYIPMATTEGALIASHNRGAKIISLSGGVRVVCLTEGVSRAPGFIFNDLIESGQFVIWVVEHYEDFKGIVKNCTTHGQLEDVRITMEGNHVYLNFEYTTGDAAGQNMVTIASDAICRYIVARSPQKPLYWFIESNMSGDKKATAMSYLFVRGKKVIAEVVIPRTLFKKMLHVDPEVMMEYWKISFVGGVQSGSIGVQGHYANGLAAIFIACGQDAACVSEASVGITRVDITKEKDLYISVSLPNLIVGTIGGGTNLPTQRECLEMIGCKGEGTARKFAEICAATVLAGEISIMGALAAGQFTRAHMKYGRKHAKRTA